MSDGRRRKPLIIRYTHSKGSTHHKTKLKIVVPNISRENLALLTEEVTRAAEFLAGEKHIDSIDTKTLNIMVNEALSRLNALVEFNKQVHKKSLELLSRAISVEEMTSKL